MRILDDTNVIIDYLMVRDPYYGAADKIFNDCRTGEMEGYIAAHSVSNMFFILRKNFTIEERRELLEGICSLFTVVSIDEKKIRAALSNQGFSDFEDCLQMECAKEVGADYIVSRNIDDFKNSEIQAILPQGLMIE